MMIEIIFAKSQFRTELIYLFLWYNFRLIRLPAID